jgi:hypothetical protein
MTRSVILLLCLTTLGSSAAAQSESDFAAWFAIMQTPAGALPYAQVEPLPQREGGPRRSAIALRTGSWTFEGQDDRNWTFGATLAMPTGTKAAASVTLAWFRPGGGGDGTTMLGVDVQKAVWQGKSADSPTKFGAAIKGAFGYGDAQGGESTALSVVGQIPVTVRFELTNKSGISLHATPGLGWGRVSDDVDSEAGMRPLIGLGGAWLSAAGAGFHFSLQKVTLDQPNTPWVLGMSFSFVPGQ